MLNDLKQMIRLHIIETSSEKMLARHNVYHCPRVGDEIRLADKYYLRVTVVVWCYDEDSPYTRVNVLVEKIK